MSYIFDALKKRQQNPQQGGELLAEKLYPADAYPQADFQYKAEQPKSGNFALGWGLLLTVAIFGAVLLGYVLGRLGSVEGDALVSASQTPVQSQKLASPAVTEPQLNAATLPASSSSSSSSSTGSVSGQPELTRESQPVKKIAAEQYFNNPPPASGKQAAASETQLVVSAEKPIAAQQPLNFEVQEVEGVSDNLLDLFVEAVKATAQEQAEANPSAESAVSKKIALRRIDQLPQHLQADLPSLSFTMHMYSTDVSNSWVRVNGQDKYTGEQLAAGLTLVAIEQQQLVLEFRGQQFTMEALSSW
jgi:hypothetical protein